MEYVIRLQRFPNFLTIGYIILLNILTDINGVPRVLYVLILLLATVLLLISFKFSIYNDHLVYEIVIINKSIVSKKIYPEDINYMKFIRVGWAKKAAIIKMNKGINIRLAILEPPKAYDHLIEFAETHEVAIVKTKDYLILER